MNKWSRHFLERLKEHGIMCDVTESNGWIETVRVAERLFYVRSVTYSEKTRDYFIGVGPKKLKENGDGVLICGGRYEELWEIFIIPWTIFFNNVWSGAPINTYKPPKKYYQYKTHIKETATSWIMKVQGSGDSSGVHVDGYRHSVEEALLVLQREINEDTREK